MVLLSAVKDQAARSIHPSIQQFCLVCFFGFLCYAPQSSLQKVCGFLSAMTAPLLYEFLQNLKKEKSLFPALAPQRRGRARSAPGTGRRRGRHRGQTRAEGPRGRRKHSVESLKYTARLRSCSAPAHLKGRSSGLVFLLWNLKSLYTSRPMYRMHRQGQEKLI